MLFVHRTEVELWDSRDQKKKNKCIFSEAIFIILSEAPPAMSGAFFFFERKRGNIFFLKLQ